jgi:RHS repeat-associated protein
VRYKAWGEVRYAWSQPPGLPTNYTYTGQRSYMDDPTTTTATEGFGLMFYNARWYDPALGRFAQADSIITGANNRSSATIKDVADNQYTALTTGYYETSILQKLNQDNAFLLAKGGLLNLTQKDKQQGHIVDVPLETQVLDRYAYTLNNPIKYIDPTGCDQCTGSTSGSNAFGYCYNDARTIVTLYMQGYKYKLDLNEVDAAVQADVNAFTKAVDNYQIKSQNATGNKIILGFGVVGAIAATVTCIAAEPCGAIAGVGAWATVTVVGIDGVAVGSAISTNASEKDAATEWNAGATAYSNLLYHLRQNPRGILESGRRIYPWKPDYRRP